MSEAYIAFDGYTLPFKFIPKEMTVMFTNGEFNHYLFKAPIDLYLSEYDTQTIRYTMRHLNGLSWHDGDVAVEYLPQILEKYRDYWIYTFSSVSSKVLEEMLPTSVIVNVQDLGYSMPKSLPDPQCSRVHRPRYCSKAKAIAIRNFLRSH